MTDVLTRICADKRDHIAARKASISVSELRERIDSMTMPRGFLRALEKAKARGRTGLIAEVKKASPSKGLIREDFDPPTLARAYEQGDATCLSVLTDEPYFQGDDRYLTAARNAVSLPVLRKDFMLDPYQVLEARALGADCILLIMAALSDGQALELEAAAHQLEMDVLVEVHDGTELDRALALESRLLGINNRDLKTLNVSLSTAIELSRAVPDTHHLVGESGISTHSDVQQLREVGINTILVENH